MDNNLNCHHLYHSLARLIKRYYHRYLVAKADKLAKTGKVRKALETYSSVLSATLDRQTRLHALRALTQSLLRKALRLERAGKRKAAKRAYTAAMRMVSNEVSSDRLTGAGAISLLNTTASELSRHQQLSKISLLRSPLKRTDNSPASRLEKFTTAATAVTSEEALEHVLEVGDEPASVAWWLLMHNLLYRRGFARAAIVAKRAAASVFLEQNSGRPVGAAHLAAATLLNDLCRVEQFIQDTDDYKLKRDGWLAIGEVDRARKIHEQHYSWAENRFSRWLQDRSVAVVGPAPNSHRNGPKIDKHDCVIRTNLMATQSFREAEDMVGTRADAIYYNSVFASKQTNAVARTIRDYRPKYVMLRTPQEQIAIGWRSGGKLSRHFHFSPVVFKARGYAMRHILNDLALQPSSEITCYGVDFFLGEQAHFQGYVDWRRPLQHAESYAAHDPLECWRFLRRLFKTGVIRADATLERILRFDEDSLTEALDLRLAADKSPSTAKRSAKPPQERPVASCRTNQR